MGTSGGKKPGRFAIALKSSSTDDERKAMRSTFMVRLRYISVALPILSVSRLTCPKSLSVASP